MQFYSNKIIKTLFNIPTIKPIAFEVIRICSNNHYSIPTLLKILSSDQSLAIQILRFANASYYNYPREINSIDRAAIILGFDQIKEIALSIALKSLYKGLSVNTSSTYPIWKHSFITGFTMKILGEIFDSDNMDLLYMGGLLHDIGKIIFSQTINEEYELLLQKSQQDNAPIHLLEKKYLNVDHTEIGANLIREWNLPEGIEYMVQFHHSPDLYRDKVKTGLWIKLIYMGNIFTHSLEKVNEVSIDELKKNATFSEKFSLSDKEIQRLTFLINKEIKEQRKFLKIFEEVAA